MKIKEIGEYGSQQLRTDVDREMRKRKLRVIDVCSFLAEERLYIFPQTFYSIYSGRSDPRRVMPSTRRIFKEALGIELGEYEPDDE